VRKELGYYVRAFKEDPREKSKNHVTSEETPDMSGRGFMANGLFALDSRRREGQRSKRKFTVTATFAAVNSQAPNQTGARSHLADVVLREAPPSVVVGGGIKRGFDIIAAIAAIMLLLPLCALLALAIKASDGGPVFYRHRRIGLSGTAFDCLKFRTMVVDADEVLQRHLAANGEAAREWEGSRKLKRDPRITSLGSGMRKTSVDELPQLLNILKGEMSFVGPRPIVAAEMPKYGPCIDHYLRARPGLTGPWQVSGRNDVDYNTRVSLDRDYIEGWSFRRDLAIIAKTAVVVVTARGCY
jgi:exopolysaccharide production protein ExoY